MNSIERGHKKGEAGGEQHAPDLRQTVDRMQSAADGRMTAALETVRAARRSAPEHANELDGAVADLGTARRRLHMGTLEALGQVAERQSPAEAQALVQRGRDLLDLGERFADAA